MAALWYVYTLEKNLLGLPNTVEVATSAEFLEVQTRPRVLVYDWDP